MKHEEDRWLTISDVAELLSLSPNAVRLAISRGQLSAYRLGRRLRLKASEVNAALKSVESAATEENDEAETSTDKG